MKKILITPLFILICVFGFAQCPITGDSHDEKIMALNILKNRVIPDGLEPQMIDITDILKPGNDSTRWDYNSFVSVTGYIILVKYGGKETCNCHATDKSIWDVHIELASHLTDKGKQAMICEAGQNSRDYDSSLTYNNIKKLKGKKVTITGYLFPDKEHWANSVNINPMGTNLWRDTEWEIHPISKIEIAE